MHYTKVSTSTSTLDTCSASFPAIFLRRKESQHHPRRLQIRLINMDPALLIVSGTSYSINTYVFPPTPTVNEIQVEGTAIAQVTLLPRNSGGGILYSKSWLLQPGDPPVTVSHALISIDTTEPVMYFSRITESPVFLQPLSSSTTLSINFSGLNRLSEPDSDATKLDPSSSTGSSVPRGRASPVNGGVTINLGTSGSNEATIQRVNKLGTASIAAVVVGAIFALFLIILGVYMALRHRRRHKAKNISNYSEESLFRQPSDTTMANPQDAFQRINGYYMGKQELSATTQVQELEHLPIGPREFKGDVRLNDTGAKDTSPVQSPRPELGLNITTQTNGVAVEPSPHAAAQRQRELQWLEMEEARLRQRREQLLQQARKRPE